jgi:hypothetical protein
MSKKKVTRRDAIRNTAVGVGAIATTSILGKESEARSRAKPIDVTITLDSGNFLTSIDRKLIDRCEVGYFESDPETPDIRVFADGEDVEQLSPLKLGTGNRKIDVVYTKADGSINEGASLGKSFRKHLLRKSELYEDAPEWDRSAYDCIIGFTSGYFSSSVVKPKLFRQHPVGGGEPTGETRMTRPIAHDVTVHFELEKGDVLRLIRDDGVELWSSSEIETGTKRVEIQLTADTTTAQKFYDKGLRHTGTRCWLPNPDPPPMNGNSGGGGGGG